MQPDADEPLLRPVVPRRWLAGAMIDTFGKTSARIGLAWIGVVAFAAVFAPFLANSYPILIKQNGRWASPLAKHLTPADVSLILITLTAILLFVFLRRLRLLWRVIAFFAIATTTITLGLLLVKPPLTNVYENSATPPARRSAMGLMPPYRIPPATICVTSSTPIIRIHGHHPRAIGWEPTSSAPTFSAT